MTDEIGACETQAGSLAFFGRVTASMSHEISNLLTIIGEVGGLLSDLSIMAERGRPIEPEKLKNEARRIAKQVGRGKTILRNMNQFAHSIDDPVKAFDLSEATANMVSIARRFAELKRTTLEFTPPDESISILGSPFAFRLVLFTCIDITLKADAVSIPIDVELATTADRAKVLVKSCTFETTGEPAAGIAYANTMAEKMGWQLASAQETNGLHVFALELPRHPTAENRLGVYDHGK